MGSGALHDSAPAIIFQGSNQIMAQQIRQDASEFLGCKSGPKEVIPEPLPVEAHAEFLRGQGAVSLVEVLDLSQQGRRVHGSEFGQPRHPLEGALHVGAGNRAGVLAGGLFHRSLSQMVENSGQALGGLHEQLESGFFERGGMHAGLGQAGLEIALEFWAGPGLDRQAEGEPSQERRVDAHLQAGQQLLVTDQHQTEGRLGIGAFAGEQTDFFQSGGAEVLRLVEHQDRPDPV